MLEGVVFGFAERVLGDEELDPSGGVLQGPEAGLAHNPFQHQAPCNADCNSERLELVVRPITMLSNQLGSAVSRLEVVGECNAPCPNGAELLPALCDLLVVVDRQRSEGDRFGHSFFDSEKSTSTRGSKVTRQNDPATDAFYPAAVSVGRRAISGF